MLLSIPYPKPPDSRPSSHKAGNENLRADKGLGVKPGLARNLFFQEGGLELLKFREDKAQSLNKPEDPEKISSQNSNVIQEILNDLISNRNAVEECEGSLEQPLFCSASEDSSSQSFEIEDDEAEDKGNSDINSQMVLGGVAIKTGLLEDKGASEAIIEIPRTEVIARPPLEHCEYLLSPALSADEKVMDCNKNSPHLEISPIKSMISIDDYSDILAALSNSECPTCLTTAIVPDIFIRASQNKQRMLPFLKPTTPHFFFKRNAVPKLRKDNRALVGNLNSQ